MNPVDDVTAYALNRFRRCRALMGESAFPCHVAAVAAGPG
jgi:hypothetical protein